MNIVGAYLGGGFFLSEAGLALWRRSSRSAGSRNHDANSLRGLWIVNTLAITAGVWLALRGVPPVLPRIFATGWIAVGVFVAGSALRWWAILYLGRFFTVDVAVAADHRVVDRGPYRLVRHPSYVGLLLQFLGLGMTFGTWPSLVATSIPPLITLLHRIGIEEAALRHGLGAAYLAYMQRTKRLIPWIY